MTLEEYFVDKMSRLESRYFDQKAQITELSSLVDRYEHVLDILKSRLEPEIEYSDKAEKYFLRFMPEYFWEGSPQYEALKEVFHLAEPEVFPDAVDERKEGDK